MVLIAGRELELYYCSLGTAGSLPPSTYNKQSKTFPTHKKVKSWLLNLNEKLLKLHSRILNNELGRWNNFIYPAECPHITSPALNIRKYLRQKGVGYE